MLRWLDCTVTRICTGYSFFMDLAQQSECGQRIPFACGPIRMGNGIALER